MLLFPFALIACAPTAAIDTTESAPCPGMDCIDTLTLRAIEPGGTVTPVRGTYGDDAGEATRAFDCTAGAADAGEALCRSDGSIDLFVYGRTLRVNVDTADGALGFHGAVSPEWDAPWDSEACGHYCYLATLDVALTPNPVE